MLLLLCNRTPSLLCLPAFIFFTPLLSSLAAKPFFMPEQQKWPRYLKAVFFKTLPQSSHVRTPPVVGSGLNNLVRSHECGSGAENDSHLTVFWLPLAPHGTKTTAANILEEGKNGWRPHPLLRRRHRRRRPIFHRVQKVLPLGSQSHPALPLPRSPAFEPSCPDAMKPWRGWWKGPWWLCRGGCCCFCRS